MEVPKPGIHFSPAIPASNNRSKAYTSLSIVQICLVKVGLFC